MGEEFPLWSRMRCTLPFADHSFDLVTTAFGFRNLANYEAGLAEIFRVLKQTERRRFSNLRSPSPDGSEICTAGIFERCSHGWAD
jgi:ubiquinone/menaquinone biosynthesis C-methylase UbiE